MFGDVSQAQLEELIHGVEIEGMRYGPIDANLERRTGRNGWVEMRLTEGKNREVRRVLEHLEPAGLAADPHRLRRLRARRPAGRRGRRSAAARSGRVPENAEMRIIAGEWRGRPLAAPQGSDTRPTSDRAREGLFSMLASRVGSFEGLRVADLFAGTGALGLEALSRGAAALPVRRE